MKIAQQAKRASKQLTSLSTEKKNAALQNLITLIEKHTADIIHHNQKDVLQVTQQKLAPALIDRLVLDEKRIKDICKSLQTIIQLQDPVGEVVMGKHLPNGIQLIQKRTPIGVLCVIFESRPNVTIDIGALGLKSGNAVILRGGKEAIHSNIYLASLFQQALKLANLDQEILQLIDTPDRTVFLELLKQDEYIDLIVPRGGHQLIKFVSENTSIPVIKHDAGICHLYIDASASLQKAIDIAINSKTQRPSVCNAIESILLDHALPRNSMQKILSTLQSKNVVLRGDKQTQKELPQIQVLDLLETSYKTEYLSLDISVKLVDGVQQAIQHIQKYTSGHSEAIIAEEQSVIQEFQNNLDSAAIFINCSTRFHDGSEFGYGAEVGISTGKLHCRGPMSLKDLTTTQYIALGNGQVR